MRLSIRSVLPPGRRRSPGRSAPPAASNLNHISGYAQHSFSLASFTGQTITLKFTGTEDSSLQTSFVIDGNALNVS
jgi:hypothetical protein